MAPEAAKEFDALDSAVKIRVERLRVGDWRIIFDLRRDEIIVLAIAHRREVYRLEP